MPNKMSYECCSICDNHIPFSLNVCNEDIHVAIDGVCVNFSVQPVSDFDDNDYDNYYELRLPEDHCKEDMTWY